MVGLNIGFESKLRIEKWMNFKKKLFRF
jgi:hypothetical protein